MKYAIRLSRESQKDLERLQTADRSLFDRLLRKVESLAEHPKAGKALVADHKGQFSLRVGSYRIVYQVENRGKTIFVLTVKHRTHVY